MVKPVLSVEIDALPNDAVWNLSGHVSLPLERVRPDSTHFGYVCGKDSGSTLCDAGSQACRG